jgi:hypothetical protein
MGYVARQAGGTRVLFMASSARFGKAVDRTIVGLLVRTPGSPGGLSPGLIWALDFGSRSLLCRFIRSRRVPQGSVVFAEVLSEGPEHGGRRG